jgi:DNA-binding MarR family transcriptional regulator
MAETDRMTRITITYGTQATIDEIQTIWAAITADPRTTVRCLKQQTGIRHAKVFAIIQFLEAAGYIAHDPRTAGRRIVIPFVIVEAKHETAKLPAGSSSMPTLQENIPAHWSTELSILQKATRQPAGKIER